MRPVIPGEQMPAGKLARVWAQRETGIRNGLIPSRKEITMIQYQTIITEIPQHQVFLLRDLFPTISQPQPTPPKVPGWSTVTVHVANQQFPAICVKGERQ